MGETDGISEKKAVRESEQKKIELEERVLDKNEQLAKKKPGCLCRR